MAPPHHAQFTGASTAFTPRLQPQNTTGYPRDLTGLHHKKHSQPAFPRFACGAPNPRTVGALPSSWFTREWGWIIQRGTTDSEAHDWWFLQVVDPITSSKTCGCDRQTIGLGTCHFRCPSRTRLSLSNFLFSLLFLAQGANFESTLGSSVFLRHHIENPGACIILGRWEVMEAMAKHGRFWYVRHSGVTIG